MRFVLVLLIFTISARAQSQLTGKIYDQQTRVGIPFVSIGFPGKTIGTVSDEQGNFSFSIPENKELDSMKLMVVGYKTKAIPFSLLQQNGTNEISLQPAVYELNEVVIKPRNFKYKKLGNTKYSKKNCTGFADVGGNWKGSEAAVLFKIDKEVILEYFAFYIIQNKYRDSLKFRLNFITQAIQNGLETSSKTRQ